MSYLYSPATNAFYPQEMKASYMLSGTWPEDGVSVDNAVYEAFTCAAPEGKIRSSGVDGYPCWTDIPPLSSEEITAQANEEKDRLITSANDYMNTRQWPGKAAIGRLKGDDLAQYNLWLDYLDALDTVNISSAPDINWPVSPQVN